MTNQNTPDLRNGRCACEWAGDKLKVVCFAHLTAAREFDERPAPADRPTVEPAGVSAPPFPKWPCETLQSMAEIGEAFMNALPEGYSWCQSPAEVIADLQNDRDEARQQLAEMRANDARYRHIRSEECGLTLKHDLLFGEDLDAQLDAEIARLPATLAPTSRPSKSVAKRIAAQKGEPNPFEQPSRGECDHKQPPSPPPTDDIVAGLRKLKTWAGYLCAEEREELFDRAIAALGEKGASTVCYQQARCLICGNEGAPYLIADSKGYGIACCAKCRGAVQLVPARPATGEAP